MIPGHMEGIGQAVLTYLNTRLWRSSGRRGLTAGKSTKKTSRSKQPPFAKKSWSWRRSILTCLPSRIVGSTPVRQSSYSRPVRILNSFAASDAVNSSSQSLLTCSSLGLKTAAS